MILRGLVWVLIGTGSALAEPAMELPPVEVRATPFSTWSGADSRAQSRISGSDPRVASSVNLDQGLRHSPGFRLFRRTDSGIAHPTTQGLSLRGVHANGAGRSLVTRDGIPLNDPFGGWVPWSRIHPLSVGEVRITRDGGVVPGGWASMGGSLDLQAPDQAASRIYARAGNHLDYEVAGYSAIDFGHRLTAHGRRVDYRGYHVLDARDRGTIDEKVGFTLDQWAFGGELAWDGWKGSVMVDHFDEQRRNGTPLGRNRSQGTDVHVRLADERTAWSFWHQERDFANVFTRINADRSEERAVLDQFDVPSRGTGIVGRHRTLGGLAFGADFQERQGETHERFRNLGAGFTREREAGGRSRVAGLFVEERFGSFDAALRMEFLHDDRGRRVVRDLSGALLEDETFPDREEVEPAARIGWQEQAGDLAFRASGFTAARNPSLNERYRPFRVGNDITLANEALEPERVYGVEAGTRWHSGPQGLGLSAFVNRIDDVIANATLVEGPSDDPRFGFVPADGSGRQRRNLDAAWLAGLEAEGQWRMVRGLRGEGTYLFTYSEVDDPGLLDGKALAQTPEHSASLSLWLDPVAAWEFGLLFDVIGEQFDDDVNRRVLDAAATWGLMLQWQVNAAWEISVHADNLFDADVPFRMDGDGREFLTRRRSVSVKIGVTW